jgi:hypothetical protein
VVPAESPLAAWQTFYVIVGSSAGALTGLQFVVIALSAQNSAVRRSEHALLTFGTPTIVHFCAVLLAAAVLCVPWASLSTAGIALTLSAAAGIGYTAIVIGRAWRVREYEPVLEDWIWHALFPGIGYVAQLAAGLGLPDHPSGALLVMGGAALLLIFTGIHNAWDSAAYIATADLRAAAGATAPPAPGAAVPGPQPGPSGQAGRRSP